MAIISKVDKVFEHEETIKRNIVEQTKLMTEFNDEELKEWSLRTFGEENTIWNKKYGHPGHSIGLNSALSPVKMMDLDKMHKDVANRIWLFEHKFTSPNGVDTQIRIQQGLYDRLTGAKGYCICSHYGHYDFMEPKILHIHEARIEYLSIDGVEIKRKYWVEDHWTVGLLMKLTLAENYEETIESWKQNSILLSQKR